jgi:hypothetical protein
MTPSAMTAAGRTTPARTAVPNRSATARADAHRRALRTRPAPRVPRRVSGPVAPRHRPTTAPRQGAALGMRALSMVRSLPEHSLIDRLVRGRAWIPVLGVLLAGIVAMQVEVLKVGTNVGRYVARSAALQTQNESLQATVATLSDSQRIERLAAGMGLVMPTPATIAFVGASPGSDPARAIGNIHAPDPTSFANGLASQIASAAAATAPPGTSASAATSSSVSTSLAPASPTTTTGGTATTPSTTNSSATSSAGASAATPPAATPATSPQSLSTGAAAIAPASSSQSGG